MKNGELNRREIEKLVIQLFESFPNSGATRENLKAYISILETEDVNFIKQRIYKLIKSWKPTYGNKIPSISDILTPEINKSEIETAWEYFVKHRMDNYRFIKMDDWVYTLKIKLGIHRCEETLGGDCTWIKKDFERLYIMYKNRELELSSDHSMDNVITSGNKCVMLPGGEINADRFKNLLHEIKDKQLKLSEHTQEIKSISDKFDINKMSGLPTNQ